MKFIFTILFFISAILGSISDSNAQSNEAPLVYMIKTKESLDSIANKLLPRYKDKYNKRINDFKKDLMQWNPQITNWSEIPLFSNIYIEYPYPVYISHPYAPRLEAGTSYTVLNSDAETPSGTNKFTIFGMYTASVGSFQEQMTTQEGDIKSTQNSPLSLGVGTTIFLDKANKMLSSSVYWSSLRASKLTGTGITSKQLDANDEIGFNLYYQQLSPWAGFSFYGGVDYEQFSTFNTTSFIDGAELAFNKNKVIYGTIGTGRTFFWDDQKILVKASLATSLKSSSSSENPIDKFTGQRLLLFASIKGDGRFTYHIIYKRHMFSGPTKLTIDRIGAGIGFVVF